jgi:hypothetical protein
MRPLLRFLSRALTADPDHRTPARTRWEHWDGQGVSPTGLVEPQALAERGRARPSADDTVADRLARLMMLCSPERPRLRNPAMPILVFLILVILIAQIGFWDTFAAILGGVAMLVLFLLLAIAFVALGGLLLIRRLRS